MWLRDVKFFSCIEALDSSEGEDRQQQDVLASSVMQLVVSIAQEREGSIWLGKPRFFAVLRAIGQWLLSSDGGGIPPLYVSWN